MSDPLVQAVRARKGEERSYQTGKRGGRFYISASGRKVYERRDPLVQAVKGPKPETTPKKLADSKHTRASVKSAIDKLPATERPERFGSDGSALQFDDSPEPEAQPDQGQRLGRWAESGPTASDPKRVGSR